MSVTDEIKARLDIVDFIGNYVQLKKTGRNYKALCPFHNEKTPSFVIFPDSQQWRCFGACSEGGDIFSFVMKIEGWDFPDALRFLADKAGVELQPVTPAQEEAQEAAERLRSLLEETMEFYNWQLLNSPNAEYARSYVESRGLSPDTVQNFGLGYSPQSWDSTMNALLERGYSKDELVQAGLLVVRDDDRVYDRFRDRLMIPIHDVRGRVVGFGARALAKDAVPKYLNSPQSAVFDKSRLLYGLAHARRSIRESETAVIVEGYMDVLQAHQAGFTNVVAEMGTALTESQLGLLARYAKKLILALDPDAAGQMATDRGREVIERVSKAAAEQVSDEGLWTFDAAERDYRAKLTTEFDARGMLSYESRLGFDIRVITLPPGQDPDDLIREQPDAWEQMITGAQPIVEYVIQKTTDDRDLENPKVKSQVAREIIPLIEDVADPVERAHYRQRLARLLKVPEGTLFSGPAPHVKGRSSASGRTPAGGPPRALSDSGTQFGAQTRSREAFCLAALLRYPRMIYRINRALSSYLSPEQFAEEPPDEAVRGPSDTMSSQILPADFAYPEHRAIFEIWLRALDQDDAAPSIYLHEHLSTETYEIVGSWESLPLYSILRNVRPPDKDFTEDKVFDEVLMGVLELREKRLGETLREISFLMQDADGGGNSLTVGEYWDSLEALLLARQRILKAMKQYGPGVKQGANA